eukprot:scaffold286682_cov89-Cyclotella_meneghiniana.AAC.4
MAEAATKAVAAANKNAPELKLSKCGDDKGEETKQPINFRIVPNMKDLMGARILTGLQPGDVQKLKDSIDTFDPSTAQSIMQKANTHSTGFTQPYNQVPVFAIAQMRVRKKDEQGNPSGDAMLPMHLSTKTMTDTWNEFIENSPGFTDSDATLQLVELHNLVKMMQTDSDFDFRNVVFITPSYEQNNDQNGEDEDSDEDDDGGGGDDGMRANDSMVDDISVESFVSYSGSTLAGLEI